MNVLQLIPGIGDLIEKFVPDPDKKQELKLELAKLETQETVARMNALQAMFSNKSIFVSGAIPALIWVFVLSLVNNYILLPWARGFGLSVPDIPLPESVVALVGATIMAILGKKYKDDQETYYSNGQVKSLSKKRIEAELQSKAQPVRVKPSVDYNDPEAVDRRLREIAKEKGIE